MSRAKKEFVSRPFATIKGISIAEKAPKPSPAPEVKTAPPDLHEDDLLFLREMQGIRRIRPVRNSRRIITPNLEEEGLAESSSLQEDDSHLFLETVSRLKMDLRFSDDPPEKKVSVRRKPVGRLRQLRRGTIRLDLELDLKGLNQEEALDFLSSFVTAACRRQQQAVLVITGKSSSRAGEPALYESVTHWLAEAGQDMVAEFCTAPEDIGGDGALVVFLKTGNHNS